MTAEGGIRLTLDQGNALREIVQACAFGESHLLTGYAGSGKTTLMQEVVREMSGRGMRTVLTAPTHKAVQVLRRKLDGAGMASVPCRTLASLLSLQPEVRSDRQVFVRRRGAEPINDDVVVIDECSMVGEDVARHCRRYLQESFVLYVGDPAQLPPVGERASVTFDERSRSHLDTVVRQGAGNPVLEAATVLRACQGGDMDWSWVRSAKAPPHGVYVPKDADGWMRHAFTSAERAADPDRFRFLCWTNARVAEVNQRVRRWLYPDADERPFARGERAVAKAPLSVDGVVLCNTNEELTVEAVDASCFRFEFPARPPLAAWTASVASWRVCVRTDAGLCFEAEMCRNDRALRAALDRAADEAADAKRRWHDRAEFVASMIRLEPTYALTVHGAQGSTFTNVFVDVADIGRRVESNLLEAQQLFYVAATRATDAMILVGAP